METAQRVPRLVSDNQLSTLADLVTTLPLMTQMTATLPLPRTVPFST